MRVVLHPEAGVELEAAALWYKERHPGLGGDFLIEFEGTLRRILAEPERWRESHAQNRKLNFHRFPYAIVYATNSGLLYFTAVMHLHRRPNYLQHRQPSRALSFC